MTKKKEPKVVVITTNKIVQLFPVKKTEVLELKKKNEEPEDPGPVAA